MKKYLFVLIFILTNTKLFAQAKGFTISVDIENYTVTYTEQNYTETVHLTMVDWIDFTTEKKTCLKLRDGRIIYHTVIEKGTYFIQKWDLINQKNEKFNCDCVYDYRIHN